MLGYRETGCAGRSRIHSSLSLSLSMYIYMSGSISVSLTLISAFARKLRVQRREVCVYVEGIHGRRKQRIMVITVIIRRPLRTRLCSSWKIRRFVAARESSCGLFFSSLFLFLLRFIDMFTGRKEN